jgi:hypothetical protein
MTELAHAIGKSEDAIYELKDALSEYGAEWAANNTQL